VLREEKRERLIPFNPLVDVESLGVQSNKPDALSYGELEKLFPYFNIFFGSCSPYSESDW
jgi:hypothetical protein